MTVLERLRSIDYLFRRQYYSFRRTFLWPEASYKRGMIKRIQSIYNYGYFVETGTYQGETPLYFRKDFEKIWTIELDDKLFRDASQALKRWPNICCVHGDSKSVLPDIVQHLDKPSIFWLDGHYSGEGTAKGELEAPIIQELEAIRHGSRNDHIIIIDDVSDFSAAKGNTPLSSVLSTLESINGEYRFYFDYDMLFALPYEKESNEFWRKIAYPFVIR